MNIKKISCLIILSIFSLINIQLFADDRLKYAESFEKSGDFKSSARLFGELFTSNPKNQDYFYGVVRSYKALNQFTELMPFIEKRLEIDRSATTYAIYGEILWRTGKTNEANSAWGKGLEFQPNNKQTYELVAESQVAVKQFEKAIETFKRARIFYKTDLIFSEELSQLFTAVGDAENGLSEILRSFELTKNTAIAEGRLSALKLIKGADQLIDKELNSRYSKTENYEGYRLLIWHLRSKGDFEKSLEMTIKLDDQLSLRGSEIINFAKTSQNDGQFIVALKAYNRIIEMGDKLPYFQNALFGLAHTLEQQMEIEKKFDPKSIKEIINKYRNIVEKFPQSNAALDCQLRIGIIYLSYLKDIESAKREFQSLYSNPAYYNSVAMAGNYLGKIYIMQNDLIAAKRIFNDNIKKFGRNFAEIVDDAKISIADIYFFEGEIDTALKSYQDASIKTTSNYSNNALEMIDLIENNKTQNLALREFANAYLFERQSKLDSAVYYYKKAVKSGAGADIEEVAALKICKIYFNNDSLNKAITEFKNFIEKYPQSIFADYAAFNLGKSYFKMKNYKEADVALKDFLVKYPRSLMLADARKLIKIISDEEKKKIN